MTKYRITIITPVFNGEKYMKKCIENVVEQNCAGIEHIIVDGGSNDKTLNIVQGLSEKYSHIKWISEKGINQSTAMNKGVLMAKAEIISFLNVDDFYEKGTLRFVVDIFKELPSLSFLVGNCNVWDEKGCLKIINKPSKMKLEELLMSIKVNPFPVNPSAYFYHKELHNRVGFYDVSEHYSMDLDFILRVVQKANIKYIDKKLGNFVLHENTKTYKDLEKGKSFIRQQKIMKKYRKNLNAFKHLVLIIKYELYHKEILKNIKSTTQRAINKLKNKYSSIRKNKIRI
ncbi:MAG: glycosyltransferase family 2 protein [Candidatus Omnitrophota bacterium]